MKKYIDLPAGSNIESTVYTLLAHKARGESVYCMYNGHRLDSDTISMDSAYLEITGYTKDDYEAKREEWRRNFERETQEEEARAMARIPEWIEQGQAIIFPERHEEWEKCVNARASDLYHGLDLEGALDIMVALENGASMEEVMQIFEDQNHSGMSASMVRNIVFTFSSKGPEFWEATSLGTINAEDRRVLEAKKRENEELRNIHANTGGQK